MFICQVYHILFVPHSLDLTPVTISNNPFAQMKIGLTLMSAKDDQALDLNPSTVAQTGTRIITHMTEIIAGQPLQGTIAETLARGWGLSAPAEKVINGALILCADHELNASSTTARIVASTGASPYEAVNAGLSALSGSKHGGHTARVSTMLDEMFPISDSFTKMITERLINGDGIFGFGHRVYAGDDPRARCLLNMMNYHADAPILNYAGAIECSVFRLIGQHSTIDFALVILERLYQLPRDSALVIFALGRMAGWIAHSIEEYQRNHLLRPRARYVGILPE